jgi:putative aldouronate transport system substrate-binding protein
MRSITRRSALAGGAALATTLGLASCGGGDDVDTEEAIASPDDNIITDTSEPKIVKEKTTISLMSGRPPTTAEDWDDVGCVKLAEKTTNIHADFGLVPLDGVDEKRNLALASGEYPEAFYRTSIGTADLAKYASQGTFIALDELIADYMPNLAKIMEKTPTIREGLTLPDGHIYSLPQIYDPAFVGMRYMFKLWVRQDWLDRFGMDLPDSLDTYEAYLEEAVKNGPEKSGSGVGFVAGDGINTLVEALLGTFGIGNQGTDVGTIDEDPDAKGKVRFYPITDGYRDLLTYLNRLYSKGLIMKDIFSTDAQKVNALGSDGLVASTYTQTPAGFFGKEGEAYTALAPLKREGNEDPAWHAVRSEVASIGQFAMTDRCEHPIELARWMDWWFSDEGSKAFFMGIEGESYEKVDGRYQLLPEVTEAGSIDEGLAPYALYLGGRYPGLANDTWFRGVETTKQSVEGSELVKQYALEEVWPKFTFTEEESDMLSTVGNDLSKHLDESRSAFITGKKPLSEWDDFVAQFQSMGLDEYVKAHQACYDRRNG